MRIKSLHLENFRTIECLTLDFPCFYSAISGRNNSGKSNVLRSLRALFEAESRFSFRTVKELSYTENYPIWKKDSPGSIKIVCDIEITKARDSSVFKLATNFFKLGDEVDQIILTISAEYHKDKDQPEVIVRTSENTLDSYKSRTMLTTIKSSGAFQFYSSIQNDNVFMTGDAFVDMAREISQSDREKLEKDQTRLSQTVNSVAKRHQREISQLLGRLDEKYSVSLSTPKFDVDYLPLNITLGEKNRDVSLEEWGSGTQNKTFILMLMLRAKRLSESLEEDRKIAPILVIEEPESFLHPLAQAEFGRLLQEMSEELQIQLIVTTHNPYFLSQQRAESNILLLRENKNNRYLPTERVDVHAENWMVPFALNLGLANKAFEPWKELIFSQSNKILLVEGKIDKQYFTMLRSNEHGDNRLDFEGEIFSYDGTGNIDNGVLLKFIKARYSRFFLTFDLDAEHSLSKQISALGMEKNKHYCPIGLQGAGADLIEGLLPENIRSSVYAANPGIVSAAMSSKKEEAKSAKSRLKELLFEEFKKKASPGKEFFGEFYKLVRIINKAMK